MYPVYSVGGITLSEVPGKTSLVIEFYNCKQHCKGCHSKHLWDTYRAGEDYKRACLSLTGILALTEGVMKQYEDISCILLMGGTTNGIPLAGLQTLVESLYKEWGCPIALYSGLPEEETPMSEMANWYGLYYLKTGDYREELGGLENPKTNQKFYQKEFNHSIRGSSVSLAPYWKDITYKFRSEK